MRHCTRIDEHRPLDPESSAFRLKVISGVGYA